MSLSALAFLASACLMIVEVVSGRMIAPYLGVSVYSWTSVIGVMLLGITLGNVFGGQLADRRPSKKMIGMCFAWSGLAVLFANYAAPALGQGMSRFDAPLWIKTLLYSVAVFFPSAFLLATLTPQLVKLATKDVKNAGRSYGTIGAWGALGSLAGTLLAGLVLVSLLGTKLVFTFVAIALFLLGAMVAHPTPIWRHRLAALAAVFLLGDFFMPGICRMETNYYCIRVDRETDEQGNKGWVLRLDHLVHSYVHPKDPYALGYGYEKLYSHLIASREKRDQAFRTFFIGGGGYALPRYLEGVYPKADVTVAEIDPGVTAANHRFMELATTTRITTVNEDARMYLARTQDAPYDLVFGDAFNDFSVPYHLTTVEFHRLLKSRMSPDGVYALNIIDDAQYGQFLASMVRTLRTVWKYVYVAPEASEFRPHRNTIILIATDTPIDRGRWREQASQHAEDWADPVAYREIIQLLDDETVENFLSGHPSPALTDDFVPTDRYLAPVFTDAY